MPSFFYVIFFYFARFSTNIKALHNNPGRNVSRCWGLRRRGATTQHIVGIQTPNITKETHGKSYQGNVLEESSAISFFSSATYLHTKIRIEI
tara:strand:- start:916 stop:1191 length:276 start_codon:yes stop_codon:yes gene_type:complete